jgi:serine/threonine-protein kinase
MLGAVLGNYRVTAALGHGGMGTVYRATHRLLDSPAAIKFLRSDLAHNEDVVERFFTEAKAASAIQHPGIIEVYDFGHTPEGRPYLVMELLEGVTLAKRLQQRTRLSEAEAIGIIRGIAGALRAAHAKSIVHRDLKPDNVFLVPDSGSERVKVLDFGIAKLLLGGNGHTQTGALMGTPLYMAPEQARTANAVDHRCDLYSLGCILYELLTGAPPFVGDAPGEIIVAQMFTEPRPVRDHVAGISPELEALTLQLLAKEPDQRPADAAEVVQRLDELAARAPHRPLRASVPVMNSTSAPAIAVPAPSLVPGAPVRDSPSMPLIAGVVTVLLAGIVIAVIALRGSGDDPAPAPVPPTIEMTTTPTVPVPTPAPTPPPVKAEPAPTEPAPPPVEAKPPADAKPRIKRTTPATVPPPAVPTETHTKKASPVERDL